MVVIELVSVVIVYKANFGNKEEGLELLNTLLFCSDSLLFLSSSYFVGGGPLEVTHISSSHFSVSSIPSFCNSVLNIFTHLQILKVCGKHL